MKNAMKIYNLGQGIMVVGSILYLAELLMQKESAAMTAVIAVIYIVSLVLIGIGWLGTGEERKAEKERKKQEEAAKKAAKKAAKNAA